MSAFDKESVLRFSSGESICSETSRRLQMAVRIDETDRKILRALQVDAWNRIRKMREAGIIGAQTVALDAEALGFEACFFVLIRTSEHDADWQAAFLKALMDRPEVQEAHRLAGDIDYILKVRVQNARAYDVFYQALISEVKVHNVTALLSMEEIKSTSALPI
jgi:Lrp/AsnC family transcriptional regulator